MKVQISIEIDTEKEEDRKRLEALLDLFKEVDRDLKILYEKEK